MGSGGRLRPRKVTERKDFESAKRSGSQGLLKCLGRNPSRSRKGTKQQPLRPPPPPAPPTLRGLWFRGSEAFCTLATASKLRWVLFFLFFFLRSKGLSDIVAVAVTQASAPSP